MAYVTPTTRSDGYVVDASEWNKNTVDNPIALRTGAVAIASQAANDIIYAGTASQLARLAAGTAGQVLQTNGAGSAPTWVTPTVAQNLVCGRLTLTTATPVTTADVTAATTLYYALYGGNRIALYNGSAWEVFTIAELSIAVPATTSTMYDVFVDYNAGTPALSVTAWTNDTTRATALTKQDGVYVLTGSTGKRYVGSFRTTGVSGQTEDSIAKRYIWNYHHRVARPMRVLEPANSWTYTSVTYQQMNASTANQLDCVVGVLEEAMHAEVVGYAANSSANTDAYVSIGDGGITPIAGVIGQLGGYRGRASNLATVLRAVWDGFPTTVGRRTYWALEAAEATGTNTFYGDNNVPSLWQAGITGWVRG
jgi:hypothetical protein